MLTSVAANILPVESLNPTKACFSVMSKYHKSVPRSLLSSETSGVSLAPRPRPIMGSSTLNDDMLRYVKLPLTIKSPPTRALPVVVIVAALTAATLMMLPPVTLPVTFNGLTTLPLKLNPPAFTLPLVMLPLVLIDAADTAAAVIILPPVMLPVATT